MTPDHEPAAQPRGQGAPVKANRAAQIHSVRKHEFAMLRELIHKGQGTTTGKVLAGLRSQTIRNKPATAETLDKINAIEEQLEKLWRARATTAESTFLGSASTQPQATNAGAASAALAAVPAPAAPAPAAQTAAPVSIPIGPTVVAARPWLPPTPAIALPQASKPESKEKTVSFDSVLLEAAQSFAQGEDDAAEYLLLQAIGQSQSPHTQTRYWALALLDIYRTHAEPSRFDWAVLEFVHWWYGKTPQWSLAPAKPTPWMLRGRLQGPHAIDLPEVDATAQLSRISIDCTGLLGIDAAATKALRHWLRRAQARQHAVHFDGVNLMVAALWEHLGLAEAAQWQLRPLP